MKVINFKESEVIWLESKNDANVYDATKEAKKLLHKLNVKQCFLEFNGYLFLIDKDSYLNALREEYFNYLETKKYNHETKF